MRWSPVLASSAASVTMVFLLTHDPCPFAGGPPCPGLEGRDLALRIGAAMLALGAAFVLDDPTVETTAHLPGPLWLRRAVRVALVAPIIAAAWVLDVLLAGRTAPAGTSLPTRALTLELATLLVIVLAVAALAGRVASDRVGGLAAGPILIALVAAGFALPGRLAMFVPEPSDPRWTHSHRVWLMVLAVAGAILAVLSADPARPALTRRRWLPTRSSAAIGSAADRERRMVQIEGEHRI
jgi:hypothetical protein